MAQETVREGDTTGVLRRVARAHELNALELDPGVVAGSPKSAWTRCKKRWGWISRGEREGRNGWMGRVERNGNSGKERDY